MKCPRKLLCWLRLGELSSPANDHIRLLEGRKCELLEKWASANDAKVLIAKVNVDQENAIAAQFGITSIPTLILFSKGNEVGRAVGVQRESDLDDMLAKA